MHAVFQKLNQKSQSNEIPELRLHVYFANSILIGIGLEILHAHVPYTQIVKALKQCLLRESEENY